MFMTNLLPTPDGEKTISPGLLAEEKEREKEKEETPRRETTKPKDRAAATRPKDRAEMEEDLEKNQKSLQVPAHEVGASYEAMLQVRV